MSESWGINVCHHLADGSMVTVSWVLPGISKEFHDKLLVELEQLFGASDAQTIMSKEDGKAANKFLRTQMPSTVIVENYE